MNLGKNSSLIGASIFVIAASVFVGMMDEDQLPADVSNTMELRQILFLSRTMPPPEAAADVTAKITGGKAKAGDAAIEDGLQTGPLLAGMLEKLAGKPFSSPQDHLSAGIVAASLGSRHLVPLFVGPLASKSAAAAVLVRWSFDPGFVPGTGDLNALRTIGLNQYLIDIAVTTIMPGSSWFLPEKASRMESWTTATFVSGTILVVAVSLLIWGVINWFRWRKRQLAEILKEREPTEPTYLRGPLEVYIWFTALFLSASLLLPEWFKNYVISMPTQAVIIYLITGTGGFIITASMGKIQSETHWTEVLGFHGRGLPGPGVPGFFGQMFEGVRGYAMIWPALLTATFVGSIFGGAGSGMDNPMALFLATESNPTDRIILLVSVGVLAPLFEEPIFRGFFYRRFRQKMTPYGAAAVSGFIFAAAHFSPAGFLPIWAIGFTLGLTYESSGRLRSSMIAHSLWNLGTAGAIIMMYG